MLRLSYCMSGLRVETMIFADFLSGEGDFRGRLTRADSTDS